MGFQYSAIFSDNANVFYYVLFTFLYGVTAGMHPSDVCYDGTLWISCSTESSTQRCLS